MQELISSTNGRSIVEMADGAIIAQIDREMEHVLDNVLARDTNAKDKRKLTAEIVFTTNKERSILHVEVNVKSVLAPKKGISTNLAFLPSRTEGQTKTMLGEIRGSGASHASLLRFGQPPQEAPQDKDSQYRIDDMDNMDDSE